MIADHNIIERMREFRRINNLSVNAFSVVCGVSRATIVRFENGLETRPSTYSRIIRALDLSPEDCAKTIARFMDSDKYAKIKARCKEYRFRNSVRLSRYQSEYMKAKRKENPEKYRELERKKRERRGEELRNYNTEYQRKRRARLRAIAASSETSALPEHNGSEAPAPTKADD